MRCQVNHDCTSSLPCLHLTTCHFHQGSYRLKCAVIVCTPGTCGRGRHPGGAWSRAAGSCAQSAARSGTSCACPAWGTPHRAGRAPPQTPPVALSQHSCCSPAPAQRKQKCTPGCPLPLTFQLLPDARHNCFKSTREYCRTWRDQGREFSYLVCCHSYSTAHLSTSCDDILVPAWGARLYYDKDTLCGIPQILDSLPPLSVTGELTEDICSCDQVIFLVAFAPPAIICIASMSQRVQTLLSR